MPAKRIDRVGEKYGRWTIIRFDERYGQCDARWICRCDCGVERSVIFRSIRGGRSSSCGCFGADENARKNTKHGMAGTPTYKSWHQMHQRCLGKHGHDHYVRNGIKVCERWNNFEAFYADMGCRPPGTTLDRIDGSKGYEPLNCRWANAEVQGNNKKSCRPELVCGEMLTPSQASRKYSVHISGVRHRIRKGFTLEQAVLQPFRAKRTADA